MVLGGDERHLLEKVPGVHPGLARALLHEIERFAPDIVQVNGARTVKYGAAAKVLTGSRPSWALVYRNIDVPSFWNRKTLSVAAYRHVFMPQMDGVIGVSEYCLEDVIDTYGMDVPAEAILNGIDERKLEVSRPRAEIRKALGAAPEDVVLLFLGSLVNQKRPDRFVRVLAEVVKQRPQVRGWLVGDGVLRAEAEALARQPRGGRALYLLRVSGPRRGLYRRRRRVRDDERYGRCSRRRVRGRLSGTAGRSHRRRGDERVRPRWTNGMPRVEPLSRDWSRPSWRSQMTKPAARRWEVRVNGGSRRIALCP